MELCAVKLLEVSTPGQKFAAIRAAKGFTQTELAQLVGAQTGQTISLFEERQRS